jgi:hypothetical protein
MCGVLVDYCPERAAGEVVVVDPGTKPGGGWPPLMSGPACERHGALVAKRAPVLDPTAVIEWRPYADANHPDQESR